MSYELTAGFRGLLGLAAAIMLVACNGTGATTADQSPPVVQTPGPPDVPPPPPPPPQNTPPSISGVPVTAAIAGQPFSFQPTATDPDGDALTFSITGQPAWASFDATSGHLWGTPGNSNAGAHEHIKISVSDGTHVQSLPDFEVTVGLPRKAAYGHYFATDAGDTAADAAMLCEQPGVNGIVWRQTWKDVEPSAGIYDFSSFDRVLAAMAASKNPHCQMWLLVQFKSFNTSPTKNPCPVYLQARHSAVNSSGGGAATCFMWEPDVVAAYSAMMKAAAAHFDANPRVEGLIFQESSLNFEGSYSQDVADGGTYTATAWRDALITLIDQCSAAFSSSRCMPFLNFLRGGQSYLYDISAAISAVPDNQVCFSGPDLLPNDAALYNSDYKTYQVQIRHHGCRSNSAQNNSFQVPGCALECVFNFAVGGTLGEFPANAPYSGGLCINSYIFWNYKRSKSATGLTWKDALPVIAAHPYGPDWLKQCVGTDGRP